MDSINELLSSVSPEELERLKGVAQELIAKQGADAAKPAASGLTGGDAKKPWLNADTAKMLQTVAGKLGQEDERTRFLAALKPLLSAQRQQRAEEAMRFLRLMDALPLLKGLF